MGLSPHCVSLTVAGVFILGNCSNPHPPGIGADCPMCGGAAPGLPTDTAAAGGKCWARRSPASGRVQPAPSPEELGLGSCVSTGPPAARWGGCQRTEVLGAVWAQLLGQHLQGAVAMGRDQPKGATRGRVLSRGAGNLRNSLRPRELSNCCITIDPSLVPSASGGLCGDLFAQAVLPLALRCCWTWAGWWGCCLGITSPAAPPPALGTQAAEQPAPGPAPALLQAAAVSGEMVSASTALPLLALSSAPGSSSLAGGLAVRPKLLHPLHVSPYCLCCLAEPGLFTAFLCCSGAGSSRHSSQGCGGGFGALGR